MLLWLTVAAAIAAATPDPQEPPPKVARATLQATSQPLSVTGDNEPQLTAFINSLPDGATVTIPYGVWRVDRSVKVRKRVEIEGEVLGGLRPLLLGQANDGTGCTIEVGNYSADVRTDGVKIRDLNISQNGVGAGIKNCVVVNGSGFRMNRVHMTSAAHEGLVVHGFNRDAVVEDCTGNNVGLGNETYSLPTALFNSHALNTVYRRCKGWNCGHVIEGETNVLIEDCEAFEPGFPVAGSKGHAFAIGSANMGVFRAVIRNSRTRGYLHAVSFGNGNGRLTEVDVVGNVFDGGEISFMGGKEANGTPHPDEGPDLSPVGSRVRSNTFVVRQPTQGLVTYNTGPAAGVWDVFGRENLTIEDNAVFCVGPHGDAPLFGVAGRVVADVWILRNKVFGSAAAPSRGDVASFTNNANLAVPGMPTLRVEGNVALKPDGTERPVVVKIENP